MVRGGKTLLIAKTSRDYVKKRKNRHKKGEVFMGWGWKQVDFVVNGIFYILCVAVPLYVIIVSYLKWG